MSNQANNGDLRLTPYQQELYRQWVQHTEAVRMGQKTTAVLIRLYNGFEIVGVSACIDPSQFDFSIGTHYALVDALQKLDEMAGMLVQHKIFELKMAELDAINLQREHPLQATQESTEAPLQATQESTEAPLQATQESTEAPLQERDTPRGYRQQHRNRNRDRSTRLPKYRDHVNTDGINRVGLDGNDHI